MMTSSPKTWGVVGSRTYTNWKKLQEILNSYQITFGKPDRIITGGAKGADQMAATYGEQQGITVTIHQPDWNRYGRRAGAIRNQLIVDESDILLAFCPSERPTPGTSITIEMAEKANIPVAIFG